MNVMLDLNVLLDVIQVREPHYATSVDALDAVPRSGGVGFVPAHGITTIYYLVRGSAGKAKADEAVMWMLDLFHVAALDKPDFIRARQLGMRDYEDAVVAALAERYRCDYVLTRNDVDFERSPVPPCTPAEFIRLI